jgi:hypothetical protein
MKKINNTIRILCITNLYSSHNIISHYIYTSLILSPFSAPVTLFEFTWLPRLLFLPKATSSVFRRNKPLDRVVMTDGETDKSFNLDTRIATIATGRPPDGVVNRTLLALLKLFELSPPVPKVCLEFVLGPLNPKNDRLLDVPPPTVVVVSVVMYE